MGLEIRRASTRAYKMLCRLNPIATYFSNVACAKLLGRGELKVVSLVFPVCVPPLLYPV